jgi:hypothetical protein
MNNKGYLPHHIIKGFVFWILSLCLATATTAGIMTKWGAMGEQMADRCFWTALLLGLGSLVFLMFNYLFGDVGKMLFGQRESSENEESPFASRLRKAKVGTSKDLPYESD